MKIDNNMVVGMHYSLKNDAGELIDSSDGGEPLVYLQGSGNIISGLEAALLGKAVGDKLDVSVEASDAYGERRAELVQKVPKEAFQGVADLSVGMRFEAETEHGPAPVVITGIEGDLVTVDGNHELAGVRLHFAVSIESIRAASPEEIAHGHVH